MCIFLLEKKILFFIFAINFFRDPERNTPNKDNVVVSPADGKIIIIKDFEDKKESIGKIKGRNIKIVYIEKENYMNVITVI